MLVLPVKFGSSQPCLHASPLRVLAWRRTLWAGPWRQPWVSSELPTLSELSTEAPSAEARILLHGRPGSTQGRARFEPPCGGAGRPCPLQQFWERAMPERTQLAAEKKKREWHKYTHVGYTKEAMEASACVKVTRWIKSPFKLLQSCSYPLLGPYKACEEKRSHLPRLARKGVTMWSVDWDVIAYMVAYHYTEYLVDM